MDYADEPSTQHSEQLAELEIQGDHPGEHMPAIAVPNNHILRRFNQAELLKLLPKMELIPLVLRDVLCEPDQDIEYVYFPESGLLSIITMVDSGAALETGTVGFDGFAGIPLVLGVGFSPAKTICQVEGKGWQMPASEFADEMKNNKTFSVLVHRYVQSFFNQCAQTSACNRVHTVEERCARWLLMTRDRCEGNTFTLTQEFLATMLGASRTGVNLVATTLQKAGLIKYTRGKLTILDRQALEDVSCGCYSAVNKATAKIDAL
jgi:CRP-like cAMP-binding protein